ncbi:expressed unknown protein [Seminavis robusta]|uniref:Uncharacterized protein n=1 Tax=Seminavis robusta TaxID=568900 RepID=A0A9N8HGA6_9STRA|nr:expressed unknown protein [Seminavis robusta]|eukprot:Sro499_g155170.1 n/a (306) ;mRNA; r:54413-55445
MVKYHYIMDEGLPCICDPGGGQDTIASFQSALKFLNKGPLIDRCKPENIEIYPLGVTKEDWRDKEPLKPTDKIPTGSSKQNAIFVHVPRDYQDLTPEERRLYAQPPYNPDPPKQDDAKPKAPPKPMARPEIEPLTFKPKSPKKSPKPKPKPKAPPAPEPEPAGPMDGPGIPMAPPLEPRPEPEPEPEAPKPDPYIPNPMDMSLYKCWYQIEGDIVPYYIRTEGGEKGKELKEHIFATRKTGRSAKLLAGATADDLHLYVPGVDEKSGNDLGDGDLLPGGTSEREPILVVVKEVKGQGRTLTPITS